jgi:integrase
MSIKQVDIATLPLGQHGDGRGLVIAVTAGADGTLKRSFVFQWRGPGGKRVEMQVAPCDETTITKARKVVEEWRAIVREGGDPRRARKAATGITFAAFVEQSIPGWSEGLHESEPYQWRLMLKRIGEDFCGKPIAAISQDDVVAILMPLFTRLPKSAQRDRARIQRAFDAAKAMKQYFGDNPADWKVLKHIPGFVQKVRVAAKQESHHASVPFADLPKLMKVLSYETDISARCFEVAILTGARSQEARLMEWSQIDFENAIWTCPPEIMKARKEHKVPLSRQALAIIEAQPRNSRFVFASPHTFGTDQPLTAQGLLKTVKKLVPGGTAHGVRATFRNWGGANRIEEHEVLEFCIAHVVGDAASKAYRTDAMVERRRVVMQAWADYALPVKGDNVVPLSPRKAA